MGQKDKSSTIQKQCCFIQIFNFIIYYNQFSFIVISSMSKKQQVSFFNKVPHNYEMMHTQYLHFNQYTKIHNKPPTHELLKQNIKILQILSKNDSILLQDIEDNQDQMLREFHQRVIKKSRDIDKKKIDLYLNGQRAFAQSSVKMDDLKLNFKNLAILSSNYRKNFQSFFDTEEIIYKEEDIDIIKEERFAFQLQLNKLDEFYPGQAQFILEELRPKVIGRSKKVGALSNQKQQEFHPQLNKGPQQKEFQQQA